MKKSGEFQYEREEIGEPAAAAAAATFVAASEWSPISFQVSEIA